MWGMMIGSAAILHDLGKPRQKFKRIQLPRLGILPVPGYVGHKNHGIHLTTGEAWGLGALGPWNDADIFRLPWQLSKAFQPWQMAVF